MNDRNYSQKPLGGGLRGYNPSNMFIGFAEDPVRCVVFVLLISLFFLMLLAGGICLWPYLISRAAESGGFDVASPVGKLLLTGGICAVVGGLISIYLCWFHEWVEVNTFSFGKVFMIVYIVEIITGFILIPVLGTDMLGIQNPNTWTMVLSFLFHGLLGALLTMVPSLIAAVLGYLVNRIANLILLRKERRY